jgi:hypothetical protein
MHLNVDRKIVTAVAAILAGMAANRILSSSWTAATGRPAPTDAEHPDTDLKEAILFAVVSGAIVALARLVAVRGATKYVAGPIAKKLS